MSSLSRSTQHAEYPARLAVYITLEVMDQVLSILVALTHWRLVLSALGSVALAIILTTIFPPFTAGYCIALVIFAIAFGVYWQSRADAGVTLTQEIEEPKISAPVAFLGFAFVGLLCGGTVSTAFDSKLIGATALILGVAFVVLWFRFIKHRPIQRHSVIFAIVSLMLGYLPLVLVPLWSAP